MTTAQSQHDNRYYKKSSTLLHCYQSTKANLSSQKGRAGE